MKVFKFGGASVKDAAAVRNVCAVIRGFGESGQLLVVVSAMGKTTNALEALLNLAWNGQDYSAAFETVASYHLNIIAALFPDPEHPVFAQAEQQFTFLKNALAQLPEGNYDQHYDQVVSVGELLSSLILHHYLQQCNLHNTWLDCRKYILTDNTWREGRVDWSWTEKLINRDLPELLQNQLIVTQGFIGGTNDGFTTTLGREGSDYTGAIFAYCLQADSLTIWKDVEGVLNADPKFFPDTTRYADLSYQETVEMAYYGASVIHPKTIKPLANRNIPLFVRSFLNPSGEGTRIWNCRHEKIAPAYIIKQDQCLISFSAKDFAFISEKNLGTIFNALSELRIKINLMQNSAISFSICTDYHEGRLKKLLETLQDEFMIHYNAPLQLFTIKNYDSASVDALCQDREILLEQRTRTTFQFVSRAGIV